MASRHKITLIDQSQQEINQEIEEVLSSNYCSFTEYPSVFRLSFVNAFQYYPSKALVLYKSLCILPMFCICHPVLLKYYIYFKYWPSSVYSFQYCPNSQKYIQKVCLQQLSWIFECSYVSCLKSYMFKIRNYCIIPPNKQRYRVE